MVMSLLWGMLGGYAQEFTLLSSGFATGEQIPKIHTCDGEDQSPALSWKHPPKNTKSFVLIVDDPDAPDPKSPKMTWVHWVLYNIPSDISSLAAGVQGLPKGTQEGYNDWKKTGYKGPCPPIGRHRYMHKIYALDTLLSLNKKATKAEVEKQMKGHILSHVTLIGTYPAKKK